VRLPAPAKVNLGLRLLERRSDGYHGIETFFHTLAWGDVVTLEPGEGIALELVVAPDAPHRDGLSRVPADRDNLAWRAAAALMDALDLPGVRIRLEKRVPPGSGLGGGSSDAAAVLRGLPVLYGVSPPADLLARLALGLGADVPFFLVGGCALATGVGEHLEPLEPAAGTPVVLALPEAPALTAAAYRAANYTLTRSPLYPQYRKSHKGIREILSRERLVNDLQAAVLPDRPDITALIETMRSTDAFFISMSGSGSAVFGLYEGPDQAEAATRTLTAAGTTSVLTTLDRALHTAEPGR